MRWAVRRSRRNQGLVWPSARSQGTFGKSLRRSHRPPTEKEKPQKFLGVIVDTPRLARRKRDNEPYARFLLDREDTNPQAEPIPVMLTKKWSETFRQQVEDKELGQGTQVVVVGFPKERTVTKQGQHITEHWINGLKVKPL